MKLLSVWAQFCNTISRVIAYSGIRILRVHSHMPQRNNSELHLHFNCRHCSNPLQHVLSRAHSVLVSFSVRGNSLSCDGARQSVQFTILSNLSGGATSGALGLNMQGNFTYHEPLYSRQGRVTCFICVLVLFHWYYQQEETYKTQYMGFSFNMFFLNVMKYSHADGDVGV